MPVPRTSDKDEAKKRTNMEQFQIYAFYFRDFFMHSRCINGCLVASDTEYV